MRRYPAAADCLLLCATKSIFRMIIHHPPIIMQNSMWITAQDLPLGAGGSSQLYIDYLNDFPKVHQYYECDFHMFANYGAHIERMRRQVRHREVLADVLLDQNRQYGASEKSLGHIESIRSENTFVVVTGQQVGILGGPLYTIYKTITAIKLSRHLAGLYPQYTFLPVFWLEGEDHDFEEINKAGLLDQEHKPVHIEYLLHGKPLEKNPGPTGEIVIDENIELFFTQLLKILPNTEFRGDLMDRVRRAYAPGMTFNRAFAALLNSLFPEDGLVFVSSNDRRLKSLLSPVFEKEIAEFPRVSQLVIQRSAELEGRYHAQIKTKALNLFLFHKGGRYLIEPRENDFSLKGTRHYLAREELLEVARHQPELLSPNVALRPICQDTILPTVAYVGGPSEIAYFAQLQSVYRHFDMVMPVIYPRASVTITDDRMERILEKYELTLEEFFGGRSKVQAKVIEMVSEIKIEDMFRDALTRIRDLTNEMKFGLNYIDSTLLGALETTRQKTEAQLAVLQDKVTEAQKRKHETALRQIEKVANTVFPGGNFQERELNSIYFVNKYGPAFVQRLQSEIAIDRFQHQILPI